jgi:hypothetical protein
MKIALDAESRKRKRKASFHRDAVEASSSSARHSRDVPMLIGRRGARGATQVERRGNGQHVFADVFGPFRTSRLILDAFREMRLARRRHGHVVALTRRRRADEEASRPRVFAAAVARAGCCGERRSSRDDRRISRSDISETASFSGEPG